MSAAARNGKDFIVELELYLAAGIAPEFVKRDTARKGKPGSVSRVLTHRTMMCARAPEWKCGKKKRTVSGPLLK